MGCWERNGEEGVCGVPVQACPYLDRKKPEFVNVDEERLQELTQIAEVPREEMDKEKRKRRKYYNKVRAIPVNWSVKIFGVLKF